MACDEMPPYRPGDEYTDVVYSYDWKYISIYLDDVSAPIKVTSQNSRAMTPDTARRGFDYFEVFFYYKGTVAKASWELGKRASIKGVYRTSNGINYSATGLSGTTDACSVLFAGRKNDKTLLAVGKMISADLEEPAEEPKDRITVVTSDTVFVTFELSALTAAVSTDAQKSSFLTNAKGSGIPSIINTNVINALIGGRDFPLYVLPSGKTNINAQYNFGIDGRWSDYSNSIIVAKGGEADKRQARYPAGGGYYYYAKYGEDQLTVVNMTNNQIAGEKLQNPVTFVIDTSQTVNLVKPDDNGIFTLTFLIPVCAISSIVPKNEDDYWYLRTAYMSYYYNIDNGVTDGKFTDKNIGGAVLCGVGVSSDEFQIPVERR
jgi:hypothetical protein